MKTITYMIMQYNYLAIDSNVERFLSCPISLSNKHVDWTGGSPM